MSYLFWSSSKPNNSQPNNSTPSPNFVNANGNAQFFNYSDSATNSLTSVQISALIEGGVAQAIAEANATFIPDPTFTSLFTETSGVGETGIVNIESQSQTQVIASFDIDAHQTFSFDFNAEMSLNAKEIENTIESNQANGKVAFFLLDTSNLEQPKIIDYFGISGELISGEKIADVKSGSSENVSFTTNESIDIDGNNGTDSIEIDIITGTYQRTFDTSTHLTLVKQNSSEIQLSLNADIDIETYVKTLDSYWDVWKADFKDADTAPGRDALTGTIVEYKYVVTNPGETPVSNVKVTDDQLYPKAEKTWWGYNVGDYNKDHLLDPGEKWIFTASEFAQKGLQTNIGTATGTPVDHTGYSIDLPDVTDSDPANYTGTGWFSYGSNWG